MLPVHERLAELFTLSRLRQLTALRRNGTTAMPSGECHLLLGDGPTTE